MNNYSWNEALMAIGAMGVVSLLFLSKITAVKHGKLRSLLEIIVCGVSNNLLQKHLLLWGFILSRGIFLLGLVAGLIVT